MKKTFKIEGMHCDSCAKMIEMELEDKVSSIRVDANKKQAIIDFNDKDVSEAKIREEISKLGYKVI